MTLWLIEPNQKRHRLIDRSFTPCFYVHGPEARLRRLALALAARAAVTCALTRRLDIWEGEELCVLRVTVHHPTQFGALARFVHRYDSSLRLYNSDLMLASLYCWEKDVFPLARVEVEMSPEETGAGTACPPSHPGMQARPRELDGFPYPEAAHRAIASVRAIACRDDEWATDYELPPLQVMRMRLAGLSYVDPRHGRRGTLEVEIDGEWRVLDDSEEPVVMGFGRLLRSYDPDLILSEWGDATLFPGLLRQAQKCGVRLSLNRDAAPVQRSRARSYTSYGRILFKGSTTTLFGRLHVDTQNSFIADQCEMEGLWELVRVTKLPVQYCARTTTGTGISYMQMELAYRDGVLIPEQKAEPESPKHPDELLLADRGGLVFPPRLGFFENVGELDFISEYPSIMARFNVSPETVNCRCCPEAPRVPELGYRVCQKRRGITSRVVERLIEKRQQYKQRMKQSEFPLAVAGEVTPGFDTAYATLKGRAADQHHTCDFSPHPANYKLRRSSLKWLLVCCFGYTGYKNARFGKIEAHEAINALARETLLIAKEAAETRGFRVLHALVDSLYVRKEGASREDYERLVREIEQRTCLPMTLEAVYHYVIFLPSKQSPEIPVPNRFFCVAKDGELKIRGLECRKHDTPPLVARMQHEALQILAEARDFPSYCRKLEEAREVLERHLARLTAGKVDLDELVISRRLTRAPQEYRHASATAIVSRQLDRAGVRLRPGETIQYIVTDAEAALPDDRVRAWTLWEDWRGYDVNKYRDALRDAFKPFEHFAATPARSTIR
jgi:DNA polymerase elongation subunit (family B)